MNKHWAWLGGVAMLSLVLTVAGSTLVESSLLWGHMNCHTTEEIRVCAGTIPLGPVIATGASILVMSLLARAAGLHRESKEVGE